MQELIQLANTEAQFTKLCKKCIYCIMNKNKRECEWDMFDPACREKSELYTPIEFDCINFVER